MKRTALLLTLTPLFAGVIYADETKLVDASNPKQIAAIVQDEGFRGKVQVDEDGKVSIRSGAHGADFQIYFEACTGEASGCEILAFRAGFDLDRTTDAAIIRDWNRTRWTKSFRDEEGDPFLELNVNMVHGVSETNFRDTLNWYVRELGTFIDTIGWNDPSDEDPDISGDQPI